MNTPSRNRRGLADSRQYNTKCVCQICTCGKHHCPTSSQKPFEGETTHHHDYKPYKIDTSNQGRPCTHHYHERHYDPDSLKTNYDLNYVPHKIQNQCPLEGSKYTYKPRSGQFYDETEYSKNYQNKEIVVEPPRECTHGYTPNRARFQGTTTYTAEFSPKKAESAYIPTASRYERKHVPFQGKTTYQTEFKPHVLEPTGNAHPCACYKKSTTKFEGESHYKANYRPYQIEHEAHCPVLDLPRYPRTCSPGKTHVNYSAEKNKWQ